MSKSNNPITNGDLEAHLLVEDAGSSAESGTPPPAESGTPLPKAQVKRCNTRRAKQAMMFVLFLAGFVALIIYLASIMPSDVGCTQKHNGMDFKNATITQPPGEADTLSCFYDDNTTVTKQYDALSTNGLYWRRMDPDRLFCDGTTEASTSTDASKCRATPGYAANDD